MQLRREERPQFSVTNSGTPLPRIVGYYSRYNFAIGCLKDLDPQPEWAARLKMVYTPGPRYNSRACPVKFMEGMLTKLCFILVCAAALRPPAAPWWRPPARRARGPASGLRTLPTADGTLGAPYRSWDGQ